MKKKIISLCFSLLVLFSIPTFSQGPGEPYHPMTALGAKGIWTGHILNWKNPPSTVFNKIYFGADSLLVVSLDPSTIIYDGYPSTVYNNVSLGIVGSLDFYTRYYWKVVEFDSSYFTIGDTWYFITHFSGSQPVNEEFSNGLSDWEMIGPGITQNWFISNSSFAGGNNPELSYGWNPSFSGQSIILLDMELVGGFGYEFKHVYFDWYSSLFTIGFGYTTDSGNQWISSWELTPTGNIGPQQIFGVLPSNYDGYKIGFYFSGTSSDIDGWFIDDLILVGPLTPARPPYYLTSFSDTSQLKIFLNWPIGLCGDVIVGYEIKKKDGLPLDPANYYQLTITDENTFNFIDENILPNQIYTYKIRTLCGPPGHGSMWSNEATAYVPNIVPVELQSFTMEVVGNNVELLWSTATETNNQGFEIERASSSITPSQGGWETVGFVPGFGTTTEVHHYSFVDESIQLGNYQYRLKQIDFDGSFEYSNIIEVTVTAPTKFALEQNYPNPFNPTTIIKFSIPVNPPSSPFTKGGNGDSRGGFVTLKIYDILGNEVATLANEQKSAGTYEVEFDGTGLPSGIYFYQLKATPSGGQAGSFIETKKMILLR